MTYREDTMDDRRRAWARTETHVIGGLVKNPGRLPDALTRLQAEYFYGELARAAWRATVRLFRNGVAVDQITLLDELTRELNRPDGRILEYTIELADVPQAIDLENQIDRLEEQARFRRLLGRYRRLDAIRQSVEGGDKSWTAEELRQILQTEAAEELESERGRDGWLTWDAVVEAGDADPAWTLTLGDDELDALVGVRPGPGDLVIVAGRPSAGKTAWALGILESEDVRAAVVTLETTPQGLRRRLQRINPDRDQAAARSLVFYPPELSRDASAVAQWLRSVCAIWPDTRAVVVDYVQMLRVPEAQTREREVAEAIQILKSAARQLGVVVYALSQLSRSHVHQGRRPNAADLRDSGELEQAADFVVMLDRDDPDGDGRDVGGVKARDGASGVWLQRRLEGETLRFVRAAGSSSAARNSTTGDVQSPI